MICIDELKFNPTLETLGRIPNRASLLRTNVKFISNLEVLFEQMPRINEFRPANNADQFIATISVAAEGIP